MDKKKIVIIENNLGTWETIHQNLTNDFIIFPNTEAEHYTFISILTRYFESNIADAEKIKDEIFACIGTDPDLFILDISLIRGEEDGQGPADFSGVALRNLLKLRYPDIKALICTHHDQNMTDAGKAILPGDDYLKKAEDFTIELLKKVNFLIGKSLKTKDGWSDLQKGFQVILVALPITGLLFSFSILLFSGWVFIHAFSSQGIDLKKLFEGIELLFMVPLPLIILGAAYNFYVKVISKYIYNDAGNNNSNRKQAINDIAISKLIFISILVSTLLVHILSITIEEKETSNTKGPSAVGAQENMKAAPVSADHAYTGEIGYGKDEKKNNVDTLIPADKLTRETEIKNEKKDGIDYPKLGIAGVLLVILLFYYFKVQAEIYEKLEDNY